MSAPPSLPTPASVPDRPRRLDETFHHGESEGLAADRRGHAAGPGRRRSAHPPAGGRSNDAPGVSPAAIARGGDKLRQLLRSFTSSMTLPTSSSTGSTSSASRAGGSGVPASP